MIISLSGVVLVRSKIVKQTFTLRSPCEFGKSPSQTVDEKLEEKITDKSEYRN